MIATQPVSNLLEQEQSEENNSAYTLEFIAAIKEAQAEIERGDFISFEEFEKELSSWSTE